MFENIHFFKNFISFFYFYEQRFRYARHNFAYILPNLVAKCQCGEVNERHVEV